MPEWLTIDALKALWERFNFVLGIAAGATIVGVLFWTQFLKGYKLLRRYFYGTRRGGRRAVLSTLLQIYWTSWDIRSPLTFIAWDVYDKVRIRIEHEIFYPRPELKTLTEDRKASRKERRAWRKRMSGIYRDSTIGDDEAKDKRPPLTAGVVNDSFDDIIRYFVVLKELGANEDELKFLATTQIRTGFVAPLHLIAGLLQRFSSDWRGIIDAYDEDVRREAVQSEYSREALGALRRTQKFIFDCWLQWGPSIPLGAPSTERAWRGSVVSLQYGYGDENNSIDLVGHRPALEQMIKALWGDDSGVLAKSAKVEGRLAHSMVLGKLKKDVGETLRTSWRVDDEIGEDESVGDQLAKGRVVMLLSEPPAKQRLAKDGTALTTFGSIESLHSPEYYSAYLWVIFAILRREGDAWIPAHPDPDDHGRTIRPWLDFIPFFEHGNIACHRAFAFTRTQLARKALSGLRQMVGGAAADAYPLRFAFACAIDESGDGAGLWFDALERERGGSHGALWREINTLLSTEFADIALIVRMDHYANGGNPHAAGELPDHIRAVYEHIEAVQKRAGRRQRAVED